MNCGCFSPAPDTRRLGFHSLFRLLTAFLCCLLAFSGFSAAAAPLRILGNHLPPASARQNPLGRLEATNRLRLAISLPLHQGDELTNLLQRLYDPASPDYHHYLTPAEFTARFGPTESDYDALKKFAISNGLTVQPSHESRMVLDVEGAVPEIEAAFHVRLQKYRHPTKNRNFYAPDADPGIDSSLPVLRVCGLDNFATLQNALHREAGAKLIHASGSQAGGGYIGRNFRNPYLPGVTLNGAGQYVGLVEFDIFYTNDIANYESQAGYTN